MHYILFDGDRRTDLLPFTYTRPVAAIRTGILTLKEKWEHRLNHPVGYLTEGYLQEKFPLESGSDNLLIRGSLLADSNLVEAVKELSLGEPCFRGIPFWPTVPARPTPWSRILGAIGESSLDILYGKFAIPGIFFP
jgi:hypothetical protein